MFLKIEISAVTDHITEYTSTTFQKCVWQCKNIWISIFSVKKPRQRSPTAWRAKKSAPKRSKLAWWSEFQETIKVWVSLILLRLRARSMSDRQLVVSTALEVLIGRSFATAASCLKVSWFSYSHWIATIASSKVGLWTIHLSGLSLSSIFVNSSITSTKFVRTLERVVSSLSKSNCTD